MLFCFSITQRADLSTSPLTINSERLQVLEFSKPFMQFTMSLISKKVDLNDHDLTTFMLPYSTTVWLVTLACLLFVTVLMYLVNFFSPYGHRSRHKHHGETGEEFDSIIVYGFASLPCCSKERITHQSHFQVGYWRVSPVK